MAQSLTSLQPLFSLHPTTLMPYRDNTKITEPWSLCLDHHPARDEQGAPAVPHTPPALSSFSSVPWHPAQPSSGFANPHISHLGKGWMPRGEMIWYSSKTKTNQSHSSQDTSPLSSLQARSAADKTVSGFINVTEQDQNCFCLHWLEGRRGCCAHLPWPPVLHKPRELTSISSKWKLSGINPLGLQKAHFSKLLSFRKDFIHTSSAFFLYPPGEFQNPAFNTDGREEKESGFLIISWLKSTKMSH